MHIFTVLIYVRYNIIRIGVYTRRALGHPVGGGKRTRHAHASRPGEMDNEHVMYTRAGQGSAWAAHAVGCACTVCTHHACIVRRMQASLQGGCISCESEAHIRLAVHARPTQCMK